jgi:WD40 repeat protein
MNSRKITVVMGCCLLLYLLASPSTGGGPSVWSYRIPLLSASALSDDGELFLVGCENGEYFVFDRYGNLMLNRTFEKRIYSVDIADNGNMIFGLENGFIFVDKNSEILSKEFLTEPVLSVSITRNGLFAVAGTQREIFLMNSKGLRWKSEITIEDSPVDRPSGSVSDQSEISISKVAISAWGSSIAVAAQEKVFLFNVESEVYRARVDLGFTVTSLSILPDGSEIAIGTEGGTLLLCDFEGKRKFSIPEEGSITSKPLQGSISSIAASSKQILVGTSKGEIVLFNRDGGILFERGINGSVKDCDISDDGEFMAILDLEGNISFFNVLKEIGWEFKIRNPLSVELSEDGKYIGITRGNGIYFLNNWENTFENTGYYPYPSRGSFTLEDDLYKVWSYPVRGGSGVDYGDINGDGQNEIVFGSGTRLVALDHRGELMWERSFPSIVEVVRLLDLTEDAIPEILVGFDDGWLNIDVWSGEGDHLVMFDFMDEFGVTQHPGEISMDPIMAMDIDHDGIVEIISGIRVDYQGKPGGIFVFEYPSGEMQWFYSIAPCQTSYVVADIENATNLEFILGSYSLCRGTFIKEKDDCHVYVMVIDFKGNEKWTREVASGFKQLFVAVSDLDGDGQKEIIGTVGSPDNTYGKLFTLDDKGNYTYEREFDHSIWLGGIADFEKDGYQEVVVADSEGRVTMYDHNFIPLRQFKVGQKITPYVKGIADLDGDGILEIVLATDNGELIIIDSSLAELVSMNFDKKPEVIVANVSGCGVDLLVNSFDKIELYSLKHERAYLCPLIRKGLEYPEIYFEKAETHYTNLKFKESREYYKTAQELYEKTGNIGKTIESNTMLKRTENFIDAINEVDSGRENLEDSNFKRTANDVSEAKEWLQSIRDDFSDAKFLFNSLLADEEYNKVKEWLYTQIFECDELLLKCDELKNAFDSFENSEKEFERKNYERAKENFMFALQTFDKYGFEQLSQDSRTSLEEIKEYLKSEKIWMRIFRWSVVLFSWTISFSIIYKSLKYFQDVMYRNDNHSTFDSLLYTFHIKRFPKFSVIKNPYYAGKPIRDPSMFFGRKYLREFLMHNLVSPGQNPSIVLYGERKTGKTSILFQIEDGRLNPGSEFIPVYIDMNKMIIKDDYEFLSYVVSLIQGAIGKRHIQMLEIPLEEKENPHLYFKDIFLQNVADSVEEKRILFLIDEYEGIEKKVSEEKLSKEILSFLKSVIEPEIKLDFIFTGSKDIEDLIYFDEWSYTLGASVSRKISFLREKDATKLIKDPVGKKVWYTNRAVKMLLEISGCHPYFLQHICFNLVTLLNENKSFTADIDEVEEVIEGILKDPMPQLEFLWTRFTENQQLLVSFLAEVIQKQGGSINEERIIDEFKAKYIKFSGDANTILNDLGYLVEKDILKRKRYRYSFCADIFRQFVAEHYPFERVFQMIGKSN